MTKFFLSLLFLIFLLVISGVKAVAIEEIVINEFASDTAGTTADPDWVEIYNPSGATIDLSFYYLEDEATNTKSLSGNLDPRGWTAFDWSNRLNKDGDVIKLIKTNPDEVIDSVQYGEGGVVEAPSAAGQSAGRRPDGGETWVIFDTPTKGAANFIPSPTPTPTPTLVPVPTSTPTLTPTSTPLPTLVPTPTPTPKSDPCSWACKRAYFFQGRFLRILFSALPFKRFW